jgi:hypothetical protein
MAYPEARALLAPSRERPGKLNPSWRRIINNPTLLARYHITRREVEALQHLGVLGGKLTAKSVLAILMLVRDTP